MFTSFFARVNGKFQNITVDHIQYIEANKNYVRIITDASSYVIHATLNTIEQQLPPNLFCKIHRSYIVAVNKIVAFDPVRVPEVGAPAPWLRIFRAPKKRGFYFWHRRKCSCTGDNKVAS